MAVDWLDDLWPTGNMHGAILYELSTSKKCFHSCAQRSRGLVDLKPEIYVDGSSEKHVVGKKLRLRVLHFLCTVQYRTTSHL